MESREPRSLWLRHPFVAAGNQSWFAGAAALVGVLHDGSAVPMALVISLCGVLVVSVAMLTRRLQARRPA